MKLKWSNHPAAGKALCIVLYRLLPGQMAWAIPVIWVVGGALIWNGMVRYFHKHPPKQ